MKHQKLVKYFLYTAITESGDNNVSEQMANENLLHEAMQGLSDGEHSALNRALESVDLDTQMAFLAAIVGLKMEEKAVVVDALRGCGGHHQKEIIMSFISVHKIKTQLVQELGSDRRETYLAGLNTSCGAEAHEKDLQRSLSHVSISQLQDEGQSLKFGKAMNGLTVAEQKDVMLVLLQLQPETRSLFLHELQQMNVKDKR
jgi:hypothetical protein